MKKNLIVSNRNNKKLSAIYMPSTKEDSDKTVILVNGFTGYKEQTHLISLMDDLSLNNFNSISFDTVGMGTSEGNSESDYKIKNQIDDLDDIFKYIKSTSDKNLDIGLWGYSLGASVAIIYASKNHEIKCVYAISPFPTLLSTPFFSSINEEWKRNQYFEKDSKTRHIKVPYNFVKESETYNPVKFGSNLNIPIEILYGGSDSVVSVQNVKDVFNSIESPFKSLLEIKEMNHGYKDHADQIEAVNKNVVSFFNKFL